MRRAIEQLDKEIKRVKGGYELTRFGEGYIEGIEFAKEVIQENIDELVVQGGIYYVIVYEGGNIYMPTVKQMKLLRKIRTRRGYRYQFSFNLEAKNSLSGIDLEIQTSEQFRSRVFLYEDQAERELQNRFK